MTRKIGCASPNCLKRPERIGFANTSLTIKDRHLSEAQESEFSMKLTDIIQGIILTYQKQQKVLADSPIRPVEEKEKLRRIGNNNTND